MKDAEGTVKLIQTMIQDLEDLIVNMRIDYEDIINDQRNKINLLEKENEVIGEQIKERSQ